jgi:cell division protein FtsW
MVSRAERSAVAGWWWTVDHWLLAAIAALIVMGLVLVMAGSPPVADRLHLPPFQFVNKQVEFLIPSVALMIGISFATPRQVRRLALIGYIGAMALVFAALLFGHEVKGARRWIFGVQPSEFVKPAFVVLAAWAISERAAARRAGQLAGAAAVAGDGGSADPAARFRPDHAGLAGLGNHADHGRAALVLDCRPRRLRRDGGDRGL